MMKRFRLVNVLWTALLTLSVPMAAQVTDEASSAAPDSVPPMHWYAIQALTRSYADSIALRWAPDEYVSWRYLNGYGYRIKRLTVRPDQQPVIDSTEVIRPWPKSRFLQSFAADDSLAAAAVQVLYGRTTTLDNTAAAGMGGSIMEVYDEQQNVFGYAMLIAEMRPDLARAMGLGYIDRDVQPGVEYLYTIHPMVPDSILPVRPWIGEAFQNTKQDPTPLTLELSDTIIAPSGIILSWPHGTWSAYDIERRRMGDDRWTVLNDNPFIFMSPLDADDDMPSQYYDQRVTPGVWEYRLRGYDSFGDLSAPGPSHTVVMPDLIPPHAPFLRHIDIDRPGDKIFATLLFGTDEPDDDLMGFVPFYNGGAEDDEWIPLSAELVPATDTTVTVDVTPFPSGLVTIAAIDTAGNVANSMPMPIEIKDLEPPLPPTNLRAVCDPDGAVVIVWSPSPSEDVNYYDLYSANALDHTFLQKPDRQMERDTFALDTISLDVAQRYLYYKVKAVDYAGNVSEFSEPFELKRPNWRAPSTCIVDSIWQDETTLSMRWVRSPEVDVVKYTLFRSLGSPRRWEKVCEWDADTITDPLYLYAEDQPEPDQHIRYYYAIETLNETGVSSGLSMQASFLHKGQTVFDVPITLFANFDEKANQTNLGWDVEGSVPLPDVPYRFVIARRDVDDYFRDYASVASTDHAFVDRRLQAGEKAEYYVYMLFDDGRVSTNSNTVKARNTLKDNPPVTEMSIDDDTVTDGADDSASSGSKKAKHSKKSKN